MSFHLTALMLQHGPTDPLAKLIAMCLTDRANEADLCWPSRDDLRARSGASDSTITRKLRMLEVEGYIARRQRHDASTVFRINAAKLRAKDAEYQARRGVRVPGGFEPFVEELATVPLPAALQVIEKTGDGHGDGAGSVADALAKVPLPADLQGIENIGDGHGDGGDGHGDVGDGHGEHLTCQKPIKNLARSRAWKAAAGAVRPRPSPSRVPDAVPGVLPHVSTLSDADLRSLRCGHDLVVLGKRCRFGSRAHAALSAQLRECEAAL